MEVLRSGRDVCVVVTTWVIRDASLYTPETVCIGSPNLRRVDDITFSAMVCEIMLDNIFFGRSLLASYYGTAAAQSVQDDSGIV